ncbi:MAG: ABC transporter ATP-binding protein [Alphaproteobacteria bacterium]
MTAILELDAVETAYGNSQILFGVSLRVGRGKVATLLGRNGMGKTTIVRSIMGLSPIRRGTIRFDGKDIHGLPPHRVARAGLGLVPEGRQIFPNLSVRENLTATARPGGPWTLARVLELFPALEERLDAMGIVLSGGEQQMLAIGRALMTDPKMLILDEATEGLAPLVRREIWRALVQLKSEGQSILIIDKNIDALLQLADSHYVLDKGRVAWSGSSQALAAQPDVQHKYLGL